MIKRTHTALFKFFLLNFFLTGMLFAQPTFTYNISTAVKTDCRAKFVDDGGLFADYLLAGGGLPTTYTFIIATGNPLITLTFLNNNAYTQIQFGDTIAFYSALPISTGNLITGMKYTNITPPTSNLPVISSTSGSIIVVWKENGSIQGKGWFGEWYSKAVWPTAPTASVSPPPACNASQITLTLSKPVCCDSLKKNYFNVSGPLFPVVNSVTGLGCTPGGTTSTVQLNLGSPLSKNCTYSVNSTFFIINSCDSAHKFPNIISTFSIGTCPANPTIVTAPSNTVCSYNCSVTLQAVTTETSCLNFNYAWNNGLPPTAGPHTVCPGVTTVYSCTLTEVTTSITSVTSKTVYVVDPQITTAPNQTVCQSGGNINFAATPLGGVWSGPGINAGTGVFNPYASGPGTFWIKYTVGGCRDSVQITIVALSAGSDDAACLGGPTFTVSGGTPLGGTWGGSPYINASGSFTPSTAGSFTVSYTLGSCTGIKTVNVIGAITVPVTTQTICESVWYKYLIYSVSPGGGRFFGNGIVNWVAGTFSPSLAGAGLHVITYSLANCAASTFTMNVIPVYAVPALTTCPSKAPFALPTATPLGGVWGGTVGIINSSTGLYDPSVGGITSHTDILVYNAGNGCSDTTVVDAIVTSIVKDSLFFCDNSPDTVLSVFAKLTHFPTGGIFTGPGVVFQGGNYRFKPNIAGVGVHTVYYDLNTCRDSIKMVVYPSNFTGYDSTVCSSHPPFIIYNMPPGTTWIGPGITNSVTGLWDPNSAGTGTITINYTNKAGCGGSVTMVVYPFVAADIAGLGTVYCYKNTDVVFTTSPPGGTLTMNGSPTTNTFNSSATGQGTFTVKYHTGTGICYTVDSVVVKVHPQLTTSVTNQNPSICIGQSSQITVVGNGGLPTVTQYTYTWSHGYLSLNTQLVIPNSTTVYTITTSDGCSDPVIDTIRVFVYPQFYPSFVTTPIQCYGVPGTATLNVNPSSNYTYTWSTTPVQTGTLLTGIAGKNYNVKIKNTGSGCTKDTAIKIPSYDVIKASFSPNPNLSCIPFAENLVTFLDLSNGADSGFWNFNGTVVNYTPGIAPQFRFDDPGSYNVNLVVYNKGQCTDSKSMSICILQSTEFFIPDIFSPNGDGVNDVLFVRGNTITDLKFVLYDRWGEKVFETQDVNVGWDGTFKGKPADPAVYAYYVEFKTNDNKRVSQKGDITLIR